MIDCVYVVFGIEMDEHSKIGGIFENLDDAKNCLKEKEEHHGVEPTYDRHHYSIRKYKCNTIIPDSWDWDDGTMFERIESK